MNAAGPTKAIVHVIQHCQHCAGLSEIIYFKPGELFTGHYLPSPCQCLSSTCKWKKGLCWSQVFKKNFPFIFWDNTLRKELVLSLPPFNAALCLNVFLSSSCRWGPTVFWLASYLEFEELFTLPATVSVGSGYSHLSPFQNCWLHSLFPLSSKAVVVDCCPCLLLFFFVVVVFSLTVRSGSRGCMIPVRLIFLKNVFVPCCFLLQLGKI